MAAADLRTTHILGDLPATEARRWDQFVDSVDQSDVSQLHIWSHVRSTAAFTPQYVLVQSDDELVAGAQILTRRLPLFGSIGYLSCGPLVSASGGIREAACEAVCRGIHSLARTTLRLLFVQPPAGAHLVPSHLSQLGFRPSDAGIAPAASLRIDLQAPEDDLRRGLDRRLQKWTRQWPNRGVTVRVGDDSDLPLLADLLASSARHHGFEPMSLEYLRTKYAALSPRGHAVLFVGEVYDKPVAVTLTTCSGGMMRERLTGFDRDSDASKLSVPSAITWHAMLWARERGVRWYDLGGLKLPLATAMLAGEALHPDAVPGPERYKLKFGGEPYLLPPAMEIARPRFLLSGYDVLRRSRRGQSMVGDLRRHMRGGRDA